MDIYTSKGSFLPPDACQTTLAAPFDVTGPATYKKGNSSTLRFEPAPPNTSWKIKRTDQPEQLPVDVFTGNVWTAKRNIVLRSGSPHNYLRMSEHIIAHRLGMNLDNVIVSTSTGDPPLFDVGSMPIVEAIQKVGIVKQDAYALSAASRHLPQKGRLMLAVAWPEETVRLSNDRTDCRISSDSAIRRMT